MTCSVPSQYGEMTLGHPRLYFTADHLLHLRRLRPSGPRAQMWTNLIAAADWCLALPLREAWIAPAETDPVYENLYDRFYAIMRDLAVTEHLAFAYALSGDAKYGDAARQWTMAGCRVWRRETEGAPDHFNAYAVSRLLKGLAVGYDMVYDRLSKRERSELRQTLASIADLYFRDYCALPERAGPEFHRHHAIVEFASLGVAALALLGDVPEARTWLDATIVKFERHLLPMGLAPDGAQIEGATFWASTMQYRLLFMDALRRVTGHDLFTKYAKHMNANLALASIATEKYPGWNEPHQTVVLSPSYGQLDYYAPVLLYLAREYREPLYQYLALWDHSLGGIQKTRYTTPNRREQILFSFGGYAYIWYDPTVAAEPDGEQLSYHFPSVGEAYARASWRPGGLLAGVSPHGVVIHAGGAGVLIESTLNSNGEPETRVDSIEDNGAVAVIRCSKDQQHTATIELARPDRLIMRRKLLAAPWSFWSHRAPMRSGDALHWGDRVELRVIKGRMGDVIRDGFAPPLIVGMGKLKLFDPAPKRYSTVEVEPGKGREAIIEIRVRVDASSDGE